MKSAAQFQLSPEEKAVLQDCQSEAYWYRAMPLSLLLGGAVTYGVRTGKITPSPRFGAFPKTMGGVMVGYFLGKFSYANECKEMVLTRVPDSNLAEQIRKSSGIPLRHPDRDPWSGQPVSDTPPAAPAHQQPQQPRPQWALPKSEQEYFQPQQPGSEEQSPSQRSSYEQMRARNRNPQQFPGAGSPSVPSQPQEQVPFFSAPPSGPGVVPAAPEPSDPGFAPPSKMKRRVNQYGDEVYD